MTAKLKTATGLILGLLLCAAPASAAAGEKQGEKELPAVSSQKLAELLTEWGSIQKKLKSISAKFSCQEEDPLLAEMQITRGTIQILKPGCYRRMVVEETGKKDTSGRKILETVGIMILNSPHLWIYLPRQKRAEQYNLSKASGKTGSNPLQSLGDIISFDQERIAKSFAISARKLPDDFFLLTYLPKKGRALGGTQKIRVWMKRGGRYPLKIETTNAAGEVRLETYSNTSFDQELDPKLFKFKRPRGVKLIKVN